MKYRAFVTSVLACTVTACTAPMTSPDGPTMQSNVGYVKDWDALAQETADNFAAQCQCDKSVVFVAPIHVGVQFASAYRKLLEEKLLNREHIAVAETPLGARTILGFDVQTFLYTRDGRSVPAIGIPLAVILDQVASLYDTTKAEVLLSLTVSNGESVRYLHTTEFYVHPTDLDLYRVTPDRGHWPDDNKDAGVWENWPEAWDDESGTTPLSDLTGPERQIVKNKNLMPYDQYTETRKRLSSNRSEMQSSP